MGESFLSNDRIQSFFIFKKMEIREKKINLLQLDSLLRGLYYREMVDSDALAGILSDKKKKNLCCSHKKNPGKGCCL